MNFLGNILWLVFGGLLISLYYFVAGLLICCTVIGIPFGVQLIKIGVFALLPFGRDVELMSNQGPFRLIFNILWIVLGWWEIAIAHLILAGLCAITIVGIPFAVQHLKLIKLSFLPFGSSF